MSYRFLSFPTTSIKSKREKTFLTKNEIVIHYQDTENLFEMEEKPPTHANIS